MKSLLEHVTCASLPTPSLRVLAGLRGLESVLVQVSADRAWVFWEPGDHRVLCAVLPVEGVELFERRDDRWYRSGKRMPCFDGPPAGGESIALDRVVFPSPCSAEPPGDESLRAARLVLSRDATPRTSTAVLCPMSELVAWADVATSSEIQRIRGAVSGDLALLLGQSLPIWPGSTRYWGRMVLTPLGLRSRPGLAESSLFEALGGRDGEILRLISGLEEGVTVESIPVDAFRPLTRAGVRLAGRNREGRGS